MSMKQSKNCLRDDQAYLLTLKHCEVKGINYPLNTKR